MTHEFYRGTHTLDYSSPGFPTHLNRACHLFRKAYELNIPFISLGEIATNVKPESILVLQQAQFSLSKALSDQKVMHGMYLTDKDEHRIIALFEDEKKQEHWEQLLSGDDGEAEYMMLAATEQLGLESVVQYFQDIEKYYFVQDWSRRTRTQLYDIIHDLGMTVRETGRASIKVESGLQPAVPNQPTANHAPSPSHSLDGSGAGR